MFRLISIVILGVIIQGCTHPSYTTTLDLPVERIATHKDYFSSIDSNSASKLSASVGDELFVMNRFITASTDVVTIIPPTGIKFPYNSVWTGTHKFNDGTSGDLIVYTTPAYYNGTIGVILDENEQLTTDFPLVQLDGAKAGRRWKLNTNINFFTIPQKNIDSWALRYGGNNNGRYVFEIVNKHESQSTEVLQTIYIDETKFQKGFVIRNVLIKGLSVDEYAVTNYKITDIMTSKS